jgi:hypothetical protein
MRITKFSNFVLFLSVLLLGAMIVFSGFVLHDTALAQDVEKTPTTQPSPPTSTPINTPIPTEVVKPVPIPEPITVILFGTGLAALSAAAASRRKKSQGD